MKIVSVTTPLSVYFDKSKINPAVLQAAADRGTAVHQACAAYARGLPVLWCDDSGYFESFRVWFDQYVERALFIEYEFVDPQTYGIVGHPDLVCKMRHGATMVVDYKTPAVESRTWRCQLAAYCYLLIPVLGFMPAGMALMLDKDGGPAKAKYYDYQPQDFAAFVAALTAYRYFREV
jgi:hypothetical protein